MSRPTQYTPELAAAICERLAQGESLVAICRDESMPRLRRVHEWLEQNDDFVRLYVLARETQADYFADEIVAIADSEPDSNKARVRVDARKWVAAKLRPRKYGERMALEHEGQVTHYVMQIPAVAGSVDEWLNSLQSSGDPAPDPSSRS